MGVQIVVRDDLPATVPVAVEFSPGDIRMVVRAGMTQAETVAAIEGAWHDICACYDPADLAALVPHCPPERIVA